MWKLYTIKAKYILNRRIFEKSKSQSICLSGHQIIIEGKGVLFRLAPVLHSAPESTPYLSTINQPYSQFMLVFSLYTQTLLTDI